MDIFTELGNSRQELLEIVIWFYLTMTDQYRSDPDNNHAYFVFNPVPSLKRDLLYNFTLALKLPMQTLGLIESLVASKVADFTLYK